MKTPIAIALIAIGVILIIFAMLSSHSLSSHVAHAIRSRPNDTTVWLLLFGTVAGLAGLVTLSVRKMP